MPPEELVAHLEAGQRQLVAIARALSLDARLIIMDEPTTSLSAPEAARLERLIERLSARGVAIVYISHKLDEVERLADRITVLRDGRRIVTREAEGVDEAEMVRLMVGRRIDRVELAPVADDAPEVLRVENLSVEDPDRPGGRRVADVSFTLRRGEILGLAGLIGAGRTDLLLALTGALERPVTGRVRVAGSRLSRRRAPPPRRRPGWCCFPKSASRRRSFRIFPFVENVVLPSQERAARAGWIDRRRAPGRRRTAHGRHGRAGGVGRRPIATLSGGNQQKAILARCLYASPSVLLLDEPTRGIDLAAKADVYALLRRLAGEGFGIVLCSSEMSEILTQCHRVLVFREGRVTAELPHAEATEERILAAAAGTSVAKPPEISGGPPGGPPPPPPAPTRRRFSRYTGLFGLAAVLAALDRVLSGARRAAGLSRHREPDGHPAAGRREGDPRRRDDGGRDLGRHRPLGRVGARPGRDSDGLVLS